MSVMTQQKRGVRKHARDVVPERTASPPSPSLSPDRRALMQSLRGSLAWVDYSVDQYLAEKYADTERENRS